MNSYFFSLIIMEDYWIIMEDSYILYVQTMNKKIKEKRCVRIKKINNGNLKRRNT